MAKKLRFNIASGVNLSINEFNNTDNTWTEATYKDFVVGDVVLFSSNLYYNFTGNFVLPSSTDPITTPVTDTTNWKILGSGSHSRDVVVTKNATSGLITLTVTNTGGADTVYTFNEGHSIYTKDGSTPSVGIPGIIAQRKHLVFNGPSVENKSITIDGVATDVTQISTETNENSSASGTSPYTKSTLNDEDVFVFKKLEGTTDEVELADTTGNNGQIVISAPQVPINKTNADASKVVTDKFTLGGSAAIVGTHGNIDLDDIYTNTLSTDSLTGNFGTIRSIKDVSFTPPGDGDVLVYNSTNNQYQPEHHGDEGTLESLSDVNTSNEVNGDLLQLLKRTATYYLEPSHIVDGTIFSVKCPGGELITSPAGYPAITQIDFMVNHDESSEARVISLTNGNTHVQIALNYDFTPSINNVITTLYSIFNLSAFSSVFSWGGSLGDRNRNINSHGNYSLVGTYNTMLNPDPAVATTASGSLGFRDARNSVEQSFDVGSVRISINTGISTAVATISLASTTSFATLNSEVLSAINSQTSITDHYTVTNPLNGTMSFTAKATGAQYNGRVELEFFDTGGRGNHSDDISPAFGTGASITGGSGTGATSVLDWTDGSQRSLKNLSFVNCISSFSNGGNTWRNALAPSGGAKTIADATAYAAETWSAGDLMTPTADFDIVSVAAIAAEIAITFPNVPADNSLVGYLGLMNGANDSFFQIRTASTPDVTPTEVFFGTFDNTNTGPSFLGQNNGTQLLFRGTSATPNSGNQWALDAKGVIDSIVATGDTGLQATGRGSTSTGAFISANCTAEVSGRVLTITANVGGVTGGVNISENTDLNGDYEAAFTQGVNSTDVTFAQDKVYLRLENNGWKEFNFDATIAPGGNI